MKAKVTTSLDSELWARFRIQSIRDKQSASAILEQLMAGYLGEAPYPTRRTAHPAGSGSEAQDKHPQPKTAKASARKVRPAV